MGENNEVRDVFLAVLPLNRADEPSRYRDHACRNKPELRQRVEILLRTRGRARHSVRAGGLPRCEISGLNRPDRVTSNPASHTNAIFVAPFFHREYTWYDEGRNPFAVCKSNKNQNQVLVT